jgi:hypothetical protein
VAGETDGGGVLDPGAADGEFGGAAAVAQKWPGSRRRQLTTRGRGGVVRRGDPTDGRNRACGVGEAVHGAVWRGGGVRPAVRAVQPVAWWSPAAGARASGVRQ